MKSTKFLGYTERPKKPVGEATSSLAARETYRFTDPVGQRKLGLSRRL